MNKLIRPTSFAFTVTPYHPSIARVSWPCGASTSGSGAPTARETLVLAVRNKPVRRPAGGPGSLIAEHEGSVVGHLAGIPVPLLVDGQTHIALATSGLVVHENHRWLAMRLMCSILGEPAVLGRTENPFIRKLFDSHRAATVGASQTRFVFPLRYSGWLCRSLRRRMPPDLDAIVTPRTVSLIGSHWRPSHKPAVKPMPRLNGTVADVRPVDDFGADYDQLWAKAQHRWRISLDKAKSDMNWRYRECPTLNAVALGLYDSGLRAVAIAIECSHRDRSRKPCGSTGEIVELITDEPDHPGLKSLVIRTMAELNGRGVDTIEVGSLHPSVHPLLEHIGFIRGTAEVFTYDEAQLLLHRLADAGLARRRRASSARARARAPSPARKAALAMSSRSSERALTSPLARRRASASSWRARAAACSPRRAATAASRARAFARALGSAPRGAGRREARRRPGRGPRPAARAG